MKKVLFIINTLAFAITLGCYITMGEIGGLYIQIFLGCIQISIGLGFFIRWKKHSSTIKKNVLVYWSIVLLYSILFLLIIEKSHVYKDVELVFLAIIPMSIAAYSVCITYLNMRYKKVLDTVSISINTIQKRNVK
ncbi:hypothetical protein [Aquimarina muelleri]|uniref:Uncharacterized protein n=1 Tax=Aquimarina muelleri TaxID=279356 RepID=A0A918JT07_9FLAO|nr:hypothetical protein [Aquimarina muelleri]MCX2762692.1 hypothetical protein [Aquimarina muelleri]GGX05443.1 hypothetical protein GCM10007384_03930 [Aquimarina muelleri]